MKKMILLFTILIFCINCSDKAVDKPIVESQQSIEQLNQLMLDQMNSKRIVMFGDAYHGHGYFYRKVTDYINYWLDNVEDDTNAARASDPLFSKMVLFLEYDEIQANLIKTYFNSGDIVPYLTRNIELSVKTGGWEKFTTDRIEFLYNLKKIYGRIDKINQRSPGKNIDFEIRHAEEEPPYADKLNDLNFMKNEFAQAKFKWFANERDQYSSKNIINFMDDNPEYKALVFYGTAHLLRGKREKKDYSVKESIFNYYLAQYLDNHFGRNNVSIFFTQKSRRNSAIHIDILKTDKIGSDYIVHCKPIPLYPCTLYFITSKRMIQINHTLLKKQYQSIGENDNNIDMNYASQFIRYIWQSYLHDDPEYKQQFDSLMTLRKTHDLETALSMIIKMSGDLQDNFDAIKNIKEIDKWAMSPELNQDKYFAGELRNILNNFRFQSHSSSDSVLNLNKVFNEKTGMASMSTYQNITDMKDDLIEYFLIQLLWIGTDDEKQRAVSYLKQSTHLEYNTAEEWTRYLLNKIKETR
ncbi:MAG: hypothetical protein P8Y99_01820 [Calditrichaceae bacterium]